MDSYHKGTSTQGNTFGKAYGEFDKQFMVPWTGFVRSAFREYLVLYISKVLNTNDI